MKSITQYAKQHSTASKWARRYALVGLGFIIGGTIVAASKPEPRVITKTDTREVVREVKVPVEKVVTKTVYKAPAECQTFAEVDNAIFDKTADSLTTFEFGELADYVKAKTPERAAAYKGCVGPES